MIKFENEKALRLLTNFWTILFLIFCFFNFFSGNNYEYLVAPFSIIYTGVLSLYAGTKEFDRWYNIHDGRHPGEWFVVFWTISMILFFATAFLSQNTHHISSEIIAVYIMVLSVFTLTQKSKQLYQKRAEKVK